MNADDAKGSQTERTRFGRLRALLRNPISVAGVALAVVSLANILFLFLIDFISQRSSPYVGILGYMVMPAFFILGLILIAIGAWRERSRKVTETAGEIPRYPRIDLNDPISAVPWHFSEPSWLYS
jgi:hypothetical protein